MKRITGAAAVVLVLAGCGKGEVPVATASPTVSVTTTTTTPTPEPTTTTRPAGPGAFVAWAKTARYGTLDLSSVGDEQLLKIGNSFCEVMATQSSFGDAVQAMLTGKEHSETADQVDALFRQSVINLCPQHKDMLP
ncbi:hypothetical protein [Intrasporangium flavum]|uniref:hypothetical protein n=1 Tax=Intrasporangium flavum TaxID=1428657 RepID=UPI00096DBF6B|nr:hypothetical protein [Intrasporangium flavum]